MQGCAHANVDHYQSEANDGTRSSARLFRLGAYFGADKVQQFRQGDARDENRENPRIDTGKPVCRELLRAEGPEEHDANGLAGVHEDVKQRSTKRRGEKSKKESPQSTVARGTRIVRNHFTLGSHNVDA